MGWFIRTPEEARAALDKSNEERDQRFLDAMSPEQRQKTLDKRARQARATQYMTGPQATHDDFINFARRSRKMDEATKAGKSMFSAELTPDEDDVVEKAYRQADNEMKREASRAHPPIEGNKKGGKITAKKMASGGKVSSASKRADGIATKGKTKGRIV